MSRADYIAALELVERRLPHYPMLKLLQKGYSPGRAIFMKAALEEAIAAGEPIYSAKASDTADPLLRKLYIRKSQLFSERAKLSNSLHSCFTDLQRAKVSTSIQIKQREIELHFKRINQYLNTGVEEPPKKPDKYPVPEDPFVLLKKRNSLRSNISNKKKKLDQLGALPDGHPERKNIRKYEKKLSELETHLQHVETAIKEQASH